MKKIVLISVGQPSTNPRLVKEADTLTQAGFDVYVIYSFWTKWAWEADQLLFPKVGWTPILAGGSPFESKFTYFFTRLRVKIFGFIAKKLTFRLGIAEIAKGRTYPELLKKASSIKADLYIAHIEAALPVAVIAAKKNNAKCGFDAEDFHRQEVDDDVNSFNFKICSYIENKYLPLVNYITASSPLIAERYATLYKAKVTTLLNVFPKTFRSVVIDNDNDKPLKLFWFSQTIGQNRGLEDVIKAMQLLKDHSFELHLLGEPAGDIKNIFTQHLKDKSGAIHFHGPIPSDKIIEFASQFDIGLALETATPINRDICLTNKIFTYIQAGLAVIASNTTAQTKFLDQYPTIGRLYKRQNVQSLTDDLLYYLQNRGRLFETRKAALMIAHKDLNWENESQKFLTLVKKILSKS